MMEIDIRQLLEKGEGISVEFKQADSQLPANLFDSVCAFLNRNGGTILLGVRDDKTVEGLNRKSAEIMCKTIANLSNNP
jgi:ATP-dependent DNA helicase RecG